MSSKQKGMQKPPLSSTASGRLRHLKSRRDAGNGVGADPGGWLAALVGGAGDAIVSENLNGIIQSWNDGATRLFGYAAGEAIGQSIAMLAPEDRPEEDAPILWRVRSGNYAQRLETTQRRKDGSLIDISLIVSPIHDKTGAIVGLSRIAHDITERLAAYERQQLLMGEMHHRMKNLFTVAVAIASTSARSFGIESGVIDDMCARLSSLARAHELSMPDGPCAEGREHTVSLLALIGGALKPYMAGDRVTIGGDNCHVGGKAVVYLSLLLHELSTNAAKHGALSVGGGALDIHVAFDGDGVRVIWRETGGPAPPADRPAGFGDQLERSSIRALNATIERDWRPAGLAATIDMPRAVLTERS